MLLHVQLQENLESQDAVLGATVQDSVCAIQQLRQLNVFNLTACNGLQLRPRAVLAVSILH